MTRATSPPFTTELVEPKRAMLPHRLDDEGRIRIEPGSVHREAGRRQACLLELQLGRDLGQGLEPRVGMGARV